MWDKVETDVTSYIHQVKISNYDLELCKSVYENGLKAKSIMILRRMYLSLSLMDAKQIMEDYCE